MTGLAELIAREDPLLLPVAHDALSARLIQRAGFVAGAIGGLGLIGCRLGLPDLGLASFGEISDSVREISAATALPLIVDADDGYGDVKNVIRTVRTYRDMGVAALVFEDQASPKKCGHMVVERRIVPAEEMERKLAAALDARGTAGPAIIARTDARSVEGLEAALERGARYAAMGVDALFVEAPTSIDELRRIGGAFNLPLLVNAAEGGRTPVLSPAEYKRLGFSMIIYPGSLLLRMVVVLEQTLAGLRRGEFVEPDKLPEFSHLLDVMGMNDWMSLDRRFS